MGPRSDTQPPHFGCGEIEAALKFFKTMGFGEL